MPAGVLEVCFAFPGNFSATLFGGNLLAIEIERRGIASGIESQRSLDRVTFDFPLIDRLETLAVALEVDFPREFPTFELNLFRVVLSEARAVIRSLETASVGGQFQFGVCSPSVRSGDFELPRSGDVVRVDAPSGDPSQGQRAVFDDDFDAPLISSALSLPLNFPCTF